MAKKSRLGIPGEKRGENGMNRHFGGLGDANCYSGMDGQWDPSVQHKEMSVIGSLCCTKNLMKCYR